MTVLDIAGTSYLGTFDEATINVDMTKVDGRGAAERYGKECTVLRAGTLDTGLMRDGTACRITNLDISALLIGATDIRPVYTGGSLRFENAILDAHGGSDEWSYGQVESTNFSGSVDFMVDPTAFDPMALALGAIAGTNTTITYTAGTGSTIILPITLSRVTRGIRKGDLQTYTMAFGRGGTPTAVGTALPLFALGLIGSAECAFQIDPAGGNYAGDALIASGELTFGRGQIEKQRYALRFQGEPGEIAA